MEVTEDKRNAYQKQWEAMSDREQHAVRLVEMAHQMLETFEDGKTIAWIQEFFSKVPELTFSVSEIEFAMMHALKARQAALKAIWKKLYSRESLATAMIEQQAHQEAIAQRIKDEKEEATS
ncbi:hypothetical protein H6F86_20550 [Phormidium sp. FACHB-592]|uniref:Uncharacterized protein n=1 Tax=Stenomitos frigidus AS-A4 TaxID=2933935 RepID=A0ABV0KF13_9CYAN|nr:hypothetical protein [Phormidium sp. FACHB-592]MBD2076223.1 hypothetical protein [Phormidium sp. FACHB-592]